MDRDPKKAEATLNQEVSHVVDTEAVNEALKAAKDPVLKAVNVACRRSSHIDGRPGAASGDGDYQRARCDGTQAYILNPVMPGLGQGQTVYRCTSCGYTWTVALGGNFSY